MPLVDLDDPEELRARWSALAAVAHATGFDRRWYADADGFYHQDETGSDLRMVRLDGGRSVLFGFHTQHSRTVGTDLLAGAPDWIGQPEVKRRIAAGELGFVYGSFNGTWARASYEGDPWQPVDDGFAPIATWITSDEEAARELVEWAAEWADYLGGLDELLPVGVGLIRAAAASSLSSDLLQDFFERLGVGPRSVQQPDMRAALTAAAQFDLPGEGSGSPAVQEAGSAEVAAGPEPAEAEEPEEEEELFIVPPGVSPFTGQPIGSDANLVIGGDEPGPAPQYDRSDPPYNPDVRYDAPGNNSPFPADAQYSAEPRYDRPAIPSPPYVPEYDAPADSPFRPGPQPPAEPQPPRKDDNYGVVGKKPRLFGRKRKQRDEDNASLAGLGLVAPDPEPSQSAPPSPDAPAHPYNLPSSEPPRVGAPVNDGEDFYASLFADAPAAATYAPDAPASLRRRQEDPPADDAFSADPSALDRQSGGPLPQNQPAAWPDNDATSELQAVPDVIDDVAPSAPADPSEETGVLPPVPADAVGSDDDTGVISTLDADSGAALTSPRDAGADTNREVTPTGPGDAGFDAASTAPRDGGAPPIGQRDASGADLDATAPFAPLPPYDSADGTDEDFHGESPLSRHDASGGSPSDRRDEPGVDLEATSPFAPYDSAERTDEDASDESPPSGHDAGYPSPFVQRDEYDADFSSIAAYDDAPSQSSADAADASPTQHDELDAELDATSPSARRGASGPPPLTQYDQPEDDLDATSPFAQYDEAGSPQASKSPQRDANDAPPFAGHEPGESREATSPFAEYDAGDGTRTTPAAAPRDDDASSFARSGEPGAVPPFTQNAEAGADRDANRHPVPSADRYDRFDRFDEGTDASAEAPPPTQARPADSGFDPAAPASTGSDRGVTGVSDSTPDRLSPVEQAALLSPDEDTDVISPLDDTGVIPPVGETTAGSSLDDNTHPLTPLDDTRPLTPLDDTRPLTPLDDADRDATPSADPALTDDASGHGSASEAAEQAPTAEAESADARQSPLEREWIGGAWINGEWIEDAAAYLAANPHLAQPTRPVRRRGRNVRAESPPDAHSESPLDARSGSPLDARSEPPLDPRSERPLDPRRESPLDARGATPSDPRRESPSDAESGVSLDGGDGAPLEPRGDSPLDASPLDDRGTTPLDDRSGPLSDAGSGAPSDARNRESAGIRDASPLDAQSKSSREARDATPIDARGESASDARGGSPLDARSGGPEDKRDASPLDARSESQLGARDGSSRDVGRETSLDFGSESLQDARDGSPQDDRADSSAHSTDEIMSRSSTPDTADEPVDTEIAHAHLAGEGGGDSASGADGGTSYGSDAVDATVDAEPASVGSEADRGDALVARGDGGASSSAEDTDGLVDAGPADGDGDSGADLVARSDGSTSAAVDPADESAGTDTADESTDTEIAGADDSAGAASPGVAVDAERAAPETAADEAVGHVQDEVGAEGTTAEEADEQAREEARSEGATAEETDGPADDSPTAEIAAIADEQPAADDVPAGSAGGPRVFPPLSDRYGGDPADEYEPGNELFQDELLDDADWTADQLGEISWPSDEVHAEGPGQQGASRAVDAEGPVEGSGRSHDAHEGEVEVEVERPGAGGGTAAMFIPDLTGRELVDHLPPAIEQAMRAEPERPRPRPKDSAAVKALREWCRARTKVVPSGFTIQVQVLDPAHPSYRFDLEPPEVDDPEQPAERLSELLGDLWLTEAESEQGGWLFARIDAAGRTLRIDRWYDQVPEWWDAPIPAQLDVEGLVRRLYRRGPDWQPSYLEQLYVTAG